MTFRELKSGYPVHMLDRTKMQSYAAKVVSVSMPHLDAKIGTASSLVVDAVLEVDGQQRTYCMLADAEVAYPAGYVVSTSRDGLVREVAAIKAQCEQALAQVEQQRETAARCTELLAELDPVARERQATEARFASLEESLAKLTGMVAKLVE